MVKYWSFYYNHYITSDSSEGEDEGYNPRDGELPETPPDPPDPPPPTQFHPEFRKGNVGGAQCVRDQTAVASAANGGQRHDPDGIPWISSTLWTNSNWNGVPYNPCTLSTSALCAAIFPNAYTMRGLRQLFYTVNPFADNQNPTVPEIELWNLQVIRHFRALLGFNQTTHPVSNDICTFARAQWASERKRTTVWDTAYPGTLDSAYGPCVGGTNPHCGATFIPSATDQIPYLPIGHAPCTLPAGAEGKTTINTDLPWSIKLAKVIQQFLCTEGITGHTGPFISREFFGSSWECGPATTTFRGKWRGNQATVCGATPPDIP